MSADAGLRSGPEAAARPVRQRGDLSRLARRTGELLSVAAAASFLLSVWANQLVFERWGLSFLQLATLADVVTSGLTLLFWGVPLAFIFAGAYAAGRLSGRWRPIKLAVAAFGLVFVVLGLLGSFVTPDAGAVLLLGCVVLIGALLPGALHAKRRPSRGGALRQAAVAVLLTASVVTLVRSTVLAYEEDGYGGDRPLHLASPPIENCVGHVMWSGERALVVACTEPRRNRPPERVAVVYDPQGWVFRQTAAETSHGERP